METIKEEWIARVNGFKTRVKLSPYFWETILNIWGFEPSPEYYTAR